MSLTLSVPTGMIFLNTKRPGGNVNIFSKLASALNGKTDEDIDLEPTEAELKKERIEFHARSVRNGPASFKAPTAGQIRRAGQRAERSRAKKAFRSEVKNYHEKQRIAMVLRGQLKLIGAIPYLDPREIPLHDQIVATAWIVQRYGVEVTNEDGTGTGHVSFRRGDIIDAVRNAMKFYTSATGHLIALPTDFEPAISLAEAGDVIEGAA